MARKRSRKLAREDEPEMNMAELTEFGGELYWAVGETSGGAPYGLTLDEYLAVVEESHHHRGWARAKCLLRRAMTWDGCAPEVGRVTRLGEGLSRRAFTAKVRVGDEAVQCVVSMPREADPELNQRTIREARLLARLAQIELGFRVPRPFAVLPTPTGMALIREGLPGIPADLRAGRMNSVCPWTLVGDLAAAVHAVPVDAVGEIEGHPTRRAHGEAILSDLADLVQDPDPAVRAALAWLGDNLPSAEPASLLHGDLLGQNILVDVFDEFDSRPALIDWEYASRGDPAHDLAIVTRGVRKPFQAADGFDRLLDAYRNASSCAIQARDVRFHELGLVLRWYRDAEAPTIRDQDRRWIENLLRWAGG